MHSNFVLQWQNLNVESTEKKTSFWTISNNRKTILDNVSGAVRSGSLLAIMGPSGSGKTTFLGAVSGRLTNKTGHLLIGNKVVTNYQIMNISGYVQQNDIFTETLTINEHMQFMAGLKLHYESKSYQLEIVKKLIQDLSLDPQKHTIIKYLSGGERRRLSFATELINDPFIIFCDEPTTGLDSYNAIKVIQKLRNICASGKLVLTTIHQPSSELFNYFDNIILLAAGKLVFQGTRTGAKDFFESMNLRCPMMYNPCDFYMKCLTSTSGFNSMKIIDTISARFDETKVELVCNHSGVNIYSNLITNRKRQLNKPNYYYQIKWLVWRSFKDSTRSFWTHIIAYIILVFTAFIIAGCYGYIDIKDKDIVQNTQGVMILLISELAFTSLYSVLYIFPGEISIFLKEKFIYAALPYYISKVMLLMPLCLLNSLSYLGIFFLIINIFNKFDEFISMLHILFCTCLAGSALGLALSATITKFEYVELILTPLELLAMALSGIWIKLDTLTPWLGWMKYLSPFYLAFESMSNLHWKQLDDFGGTCADNKTVPCYETGNQVLESYGFLKGYNIIGYNIMYLYVMIVFYSVVGFLGILRRKIYHNCY